MMQLILILYCVAVGVLILYGINCHVMVHLFKRGVGRREEEDRGLLWRFYGKVGVPELPVVTSQLPIYNEMNVAERVIDAVAAFEYPEGKHEIQVLDDSTDETRRIVARKVEELKARGVQIEHIRRSSREGYKGGALRHGLQKARGEFLAVFDADFVPPHDFLLRTIPFFVMEPQVGLVQGRWGHLNRSESLVTRLQSIGMNGHFVVEQSARNWNDLFMNFNGTGGVFRKRAILEAGNWQDETLTEDLDLSYRIQLAGWKCRYLIDVVAPAEIPTDINAFNSQQFRWAKGSIQTAIKLLPRVWRSDHKAFKKLQATLHLTHYFVHPLMAYLAIMALPLLVMKRFDLPPSMYAVLGSFLFLSCTGPSRLYWTAEKYVNRGWTKQMLYLPFLVCFGCGVAINNSRAVFEAIWGKRSEFVRTPKKGHVEKKRYSPVVDLLFLFEIMAGLWCLLGMVVYFSVRQYLVGHFLLMYAIGFLYVGG
ncbi:MAG: glycosyltransferase, partial [Deltaproteobacteria bacterium]|nr:glycosyltransferase [Deltaproteobacteria bacterium]